jgi:hypothetical protein
METPNITVLNAKVYFMSYTHLVLHTCISTVYDHHPVRVRLVKIAALYFLHVYIRTYLMMAETCRSYVYMT